MMISRLQAIVLGIAVAMPAFTAQAEEAPERFVLTVYSNQGQLQGTAMNVAGSLVEENNEVHILLCGGAGELALRDRMPENLEPRGITPRELMEEVMANGVSVSVCPLFLPNTAFGRYDTEDFVADVTEDTPQQMAERLSEAGTRVLSF